MNELATLVSSLGFPIVMCGVMAWYIKNLTDTHKNEVLTLQHSIEENTLKIVELIDSVKELINHENH